MTDSDMIDAGRENELASLVRTVHGENAVEYLVGALASVTTGPQLDHLLRHLAGAMTRPLAPAEAERLIRAIFDGDLVADDGAATTDYRIRVAFTASRPLTKHEIDSLRDSIATRVGDPRSWRRQERGTYAEPGFGVSDVAVDVR